MRSFLILTAHPCHVISKTKTAYTGSQLTHENPQKFTADPRDVCFSLETCSTQCQLYKTTLQPKIKSLRNPQESKAYLVNLNKENKKPNKVKVKKMLDGAVYASLFPHLTPLLYPHRDNTPPPSFIEDHQH